MICADAVPWSPVGFDVYEGIPDWGDRIIR